MGSDLNFPIFEVGCGLADSEVPRLIWDASLPSGKGEEAVNPEVIIPFGFVGPKWFSRSHLYERWFGRGFSGRGFGAFKMGE